ncbi:unnamed protein product [Vitrella brassicaformis CCMP3155]|uniref:Tubulin--tyrosine ligase-like protein 9 n=1 Tax=Vitrella brassicaformis (strain CCMP3155) TaxID=1169540 RepID=A0A0G4FEP2_VITBC|nr:unnamed protein product [Vitrella brassicaformis CCMP3155]|eukprot:CEM11465.1 unnamed protein product [Vitrella brassicaformis CCMP3155]
MAEADWCSGAARVYRCFDRPPALLEEVLERMGWRPHELSTPSTQAGDSSATSRSPSRPLTRLSTHQPQESPTSSDLSSEAPRIHASSDRRRLAKRLHYSSNRGVWSLAWKSGRFCRSDYLDLLDYQRLNHFQNSASITRKDRMIRELRKMKAIHGSAYSFIPTSFILPSEHKRFLKAHTALQRPANHAAAPSPSPSPPPDRRTRDFQMIMRLYEQQKRKLESMPPVVSLSKGARKRPIARPVLQRPQTRTRVKTAESASSCGSEDEDTRGGERNGSCVFICKPADCSRGRNITLARDLSDLRYDQQSIIQRYIAKPLLIESYKWDLRVYVFVPSVHPLQVYLYDEGVVRFSSEPYNIHSNSPFVHLTNASINNRNPRSFSTHCGTAAIGAERKWSFRTLRGYLQSRGISPESLWNQVVEIIRLTCLTLPLNIPTAASENCFELFGFDILVDEKLKAWLIEVNCSPSLTASGPIDRAVKEALLTDTIDLLAQLTKTATTTLTCGTPLVFPSSPVPSCPTSPKQTRHTDEVRPPSWQESPTVSPRIHRATSAKSPRGNRAWNGTDCDLSGAGAGRLTPPASPRHPEKATKGRLRSGQYRLVFPYNEATLEASLDLNRLSRVGHIASSSCRTSMCAPSRIPPSHPPHFYFSCVPPPCSPFVNGSPPRWPDAVRAGVPFVQSGARDTFMHDKIREVVRDIVRERHDDRGRRSKRG